MLRYISIIFIVLSFTGCQQALDDLNKSLEEARMNLNSNNAYNSNQINSYNNKQELSNVRIEKEETPKFNSLAEEAEYKKQQENKKILEKEKENQLKSQIIAQLEQFRIKRANYFKKYLVKNTDSLASIDEKYKNREKIILEKQTDLKSLKLEMVKFYQLNIKYPNMKLSQNFDFRISKKVNSYGREFESQLEYRTDIDNININDENLIFYIGEDIEINKSYVTSTETHEDFYDPYYKSINGLNISTVGEYEHYLKDSYKAYNKRIKRISEKEQTKIKQAEQKSKIDLERKKVQNACQTWLKKSQKEVYSLGIGENIVSMSSGKAGFVYAIKDIEKNTFLVWDGIMKRNAYVPKANFIPYSSLDNAPSKYCYE